MAEANEEVTLGSVFKGRRDRRSFFQKSLWALGYFLAVVTLLGFVFPDWGLAMGDVGFDDPHECQITGSCTTLQMTNLAFFVLPGFAYLSILSAQRLQDMNLTPWIAAVWMIVPFVSSGQHVPVPLLVVGAFAVWAVHLVVPGTVGPNRYGEVVNTPKILAELAKVRSTRD